MGVDLIVSYFFMSLGYVEGVAEVINSGLDTYSCQLQKSLFIESFFDSSALSRLTSSYTDKRHV